MDKTQQVLRSLFLGVEKPKMWSYGSKGKGPVSHSYFRVFKTLQRLILQNVSLEPDQSPSKLPKGSVSGGDNLCLVCLKQFLVYKEFSYIITFILPTTLWVGCYLSHFIGEDNRDQKFETGLEQFSRKTTTDMYIKTVTRYKCVYNISKCYLGWVSSRNQRSNSEEF